MDSATSLGKSSESKRRACSCGAPDISTSCDHTSAEARSASAPPESVDNKISLLTQCGCSNASVYAVNPPIDHPSTLVCSKPSASITRAASSASGAMSKGFPSSVERPIPCLSTRISSFEDARPSMKEGSQSALVAAKPFRTSSGRPFPTRRQAICAPSTWTVADGSLGMGDDRKSPREHQSQYCASNRPVGFNSSLRVVAADGENARTSSSACFRVSVVAGIEDP